MKIGTLMKEYIERADERDHTRNRGLIPEVLHSFRDVPVVAVENNWAVLEAPERLSRTYKFKSLEQRSIFLEELLNEESRTGHFAKITIEGKTIRVEVWTHDLDRVTELDKEYSEMCDVLYRDIILMGSRL